MEPQHGDGGDGQQQSCFLRFKLIVLVLYIVHGLLCGRRVQLGFFMQRERFGLSCLQHE